MKMMLRLNLFYFFEIFLKKFNVYYRRAFRGEVFTTIGYTTEPKESWTEISFHPIYQNNKIIGTACNARDITAFKKNEIRIKTNENRQNGTIPTNRRQLGAAIYRRAENCGDRLRLRLAPRGF